jgi:hypothetical protein
MHRDKSKVGSREKLFKAAETLFAARGFKEVSVREIAACAKASSALVGYYFGVHVPGPLPAFSKGSCDPNDLEAALNQMLPYAVAGFNSPAPPRYNIP